MRLQHYSALAVLFAIAACARIAVGQAHDSGSTVANSSDIAILSYNLDAVSPLHMADCLTSSLTKQDKQIRIMPEQRARNSFFPWLEESVLSLEPKQVAKLLSDRLIQMRSRETGLRYLVIFTQVSSSSHMHGPFFCGGGYGGAGCLGGASIGRETSIAAIVWDLERGRESQQLSATRRAHDVIVGLGLPLWIPGGMSTKTQACHLMAQKLLQIMHDPDPVLDGSTGAQTVSVWRTSAEITDEANGPDSASGPP
jgi:hypothetical protein